MADAKQELLERIKARYEYMAERWSSAYELAREDRKFTIPGGQWDERVRADREDSSKGGARPCLESPRLEQYIRQVVNDARQNTPQIKFRPTKSGASVKVAEILNDIVRADQDGSNADSAYDQSLDDAVRSSFGFFRMLHDYEDDATLEQRVKFRTERNPFALMVDPDFVEPDASDIKDAAVAVKMTRKAFEKAYPKADPVDMPDIDGHIWCDDENVTVCEYYWIDEEPETLYFDAYGQPSAAAMPAGKSRESVRRRVKWAKLTGAEILEEADIAGEYIPVLMTMGRMIDIDGELNLLSLIRPAMDSQRMYNYASSAMTERVTLAPKNKILADADAVNGYEDDYRDAHTSNDPLLMYNGRDETGQPTQPPRLMEGSSNPGQWVALMQHAEHDIQASMGIYNASLGAKSNETSGRAIMARQREGDVATFDFIDNLSRAVRHAGRVWLSMFVELCDTRRMLRTVSEDGTPGFVLLDPTAEQAYQEVQTPDGESMTVINPRLGRYDVTVVSGPSFTTKRDEAANFYTEIMRTAPNTAPALLPVLMKQMDSPGAEEAGKVLKAMLPPNIQAILDGKEDQQAQIPPEVAQQMQQMQQAMQQIGPKMQEMQQALQQAEQEKATLMQKLASKEADTKIKAAEIQLNGVQNKRELDIKAYDAETKRLQAVQTGMTPEQVQATVIQTLVQLQTPGDVVQTEPLPELMERQEMEGNDDDSQLLS